MLAPWPMICVFSVRQTAIDAHFIVTVDGLMDLLLFAAPDQHGQCTYPLLVHTSACLSSAAEETWVWTACLRRWHSSRRPSSRAATWCVEPGQCIWATLCQWSVCISPLTLIPAGCHSWAGAASPCASENNMTSTFLVFCRMQRVVRSTRVDAVLLTVQDRSRIVLCCLCHATRGMCSRQKLAAGIIGRPFQASGQGRKGDMETDRVCMCLTRWPNQAPPYPLCLHVSLRPLSLSLSSPPPLSIYSPPCSLFPPILSVTLLSTVLPSAAAAVCRLASLCSSRA